MPSGMDTTLCGETSPVRRLTAQCALSHLLVKEEAPKVAKKIRVQEPFQEQLNWDCLFAFSLCSKADVAIWCS